MREILPPLQLPTKSNGLPTKGRATREQEAARMPAKIEDSDLERNDCSQCPPKESRSSGSPKPTGPPKPPGPPGDQKEEEDGDQRSEAAKKLKPTSVPEDLQSPAK